MTRGRCGGAGTSRWLACAAGCAPNVCDEGQHLTGDLVGGQAAVLRCCLLGGPRVTASRFLRPLRVSSALSCSSAPFSARKISLASLVIDRPRSRTARPSRVPNARFANLRDLNILWFISSPQHVGSTPCASLLPRGDSLPCQAPKRPTSETRGHLADALPGPPGGPSPPWTGPRGLEPRRCVPTSSYRHPAPVELGRPLIRRIAPGDRSHVRKFDPPLPQTQTQTTRTEAAGPPAPSNQAEPPPEAAAPERAWTWARPSAGVNNLRGTSPQLSAAPSQRQTLDVIRPGRGRRDELAGCMHRST